MEKCKKMDGRKEMDIDDRVFFSVPFSVLLDLGYIRPSARLRGGLGDYQC